MFSAILPIETSVVIPMVWCLITLKCGLILFCFGRFYGRDNSHVPLIEEPTITRNEESEEIMA